MKMCIVGEGMEQVMEAARAYKEGEVQEYVQVIGELNEIVADYVIVNDELEEECEQLQHELAIAQDEIGMLSGVIEAQHNEIERLEAKLKLMPLALELGLGESEVEAAIDMSRAMVKRFEAEPACCAAGYCGTELCGGCCHHEEEEDEEDFLGAIVMDITGTLVHDVLKEVFGE